ncbi:MAG TPA: N-acetyltransferase [Sphingomonas sp.]|nr:N-acetyltransferase [Sphingomonas sp.]
MIAFVPLATVACSTVDALLDRTFGADRFGRTAYKVRGQGAPIPLLSFAALDGTTLVGAIQAWPVSFATDAGGVVDLVMIGPVAVDPARQGDGIGRMLMTETLRAAQAERLDGGMMLIGDPDYYERFFGFSADRTADWRLPGPVERHRLLARGDAVPAIAGVLGPR